jgi:hypothetical protein
MQAVWTKTALAVVVAGCIVAIALPAGPRAQDKTRGGQNLLAVDWTDGELTAFGSPPRPAAGGEVARLTGLQIPVLAFIDVPQIAKNVAGPNANPVKPRTVLFDAKEPYWYQIVDTYEGVTITVDADRRINHDVAKGFQIGRANKGAEATLGTKTQPRISIFDNTQEEGMEGLMIEYTVQKFPNIPYTVTIECSTKAKSQCKDLSVITKDQALLRLVSPGRKG